MKIDFRRDDLSAVSLDDGYRMWRRWEGRIASFGGHAARGAIVAGRHWSARDVATGGMGNSGYRVIVPVSPEARRLVREHVTTCWAHRHGISYAEADAIYRCRHRHKYELIELICAALRDTSCHEACLAYPGIGPGRHHDWQHRWSDVVDPYIGKLSWPRADALIAIVCHVLEATRDYA